MKRTIALLIILTLAVLMLGTGAGEEPELIVPVEGAEAQPAESDASEAPAAEEDAAEWWKAVCVTTQKLISETKTAPGDIAAVTFRIQCYTDIGEYGEAEQLCNLLTPEIRKSFLEKIKEAKGGGE